MTVSNGDYVRVNCRNISDGADIVNSFLFECDFSTPMSDEDFMDEIAGAMSDVYTPISDTLDSGVTSADVTAHKVQWNGSTQKEEIVSVLGTADWGANWTGNGIALPPGVAALVSFATSAVGTRLRKYFSGIMASQWQEGTWVSGFLTELAALGAVLLAGIEVVSGNDLIYGAFSKSANGFVEAASAIVASDPGYQRRRRPGTGS